MALVAEAWPASKRARASSYVGLGWQLGVLAAAIVTPILLPVIGWRGMFSIGILPAVAAYFIRYTLHEPEVFVAKGKDRPKESALRLLVKDWETTKLSLGMVILCSVQNFGYYGVMIWLPSYLSTRFGFALTQSAVWTAVTIAGMAVGIFCFGHIADRIGRRPAFFGYMLGAAVMVVVYSRLTDPIALLVGGAVMGFFVNGMLGGYGALISELFRQPRAPRRRTCCSTSAGRSAASGRWWSAWWPRPTASRSRSRCWRRSISSTSWPCGSSFRSAAARTRLTRLAVGQVVPSMSNRPRSIVGRRQSIHSQRASAIARVNAASEAGTAIVAERWPSAEVCNDAVNPEYRHLVFAAARTLRQAAPGQFFQLLCPQPAGEQPFLRRPMSLYGADPGRAPGRIPLQGDRRRHPRPRYLQAPATSLDIMGPLGIGFTLDPALEAISSPSAAARVSRRWRRSHKRPAQTGIHVTAIFSARRPELLVSVDLFRRQRRRGDRGDGFAIDQRARECRADACAA